ncbi:sulfatase domain protein [Ophiocordyceps camponoti-floridani]|uniref:Sulfatase domain protein n=1 Tax=Ophiocordyceps camponoti-floridani TaxID=2030778 RepID=A0A8H4QBB1_9HYPO|nr:sulfatase domain protein [Ophiocordyceps camponoti-floridani]
MAVVSSTSPARLFFRFLGHRLLLLFSTLTRFADRRFALALAASGLVSSKLVHVYAHADALPLRALLLWGPSLFGQDTVLLLVLRLLLDNGLLPAPVRASASAVAVSVCVLVAAMASIIVSFFAVAGLELHWRNVGAAFDLSALRMLLTGLLSMGLVMAALLLLAGILQTPCFLVTGMALDLLQWLLNALLPASIRSWVSCSGSGSGSGSEYRHLTSRRDSECDYEDEDDEKYTDTDAASSLDLRSEPASSRRLLVIVYILVGFSLLAQTVTYIFRPSDASLIFVSWTLPLLPLVELTLSSSVLTRMRGGGGFQGLDEDVTALSSPPPPFSWLPVDGKKLAGFEDWYIPDRTHYDATRDPIRVTNLHQAPLPEIRTALGRLRIRHVVLLELETIRKDVFPLKKDGLIWRKLANGTDSGKLSAEAVQLLSTLTPTANFVTGEYDDGFKHQGRPKRGGLNFVNAHTSSTYTLKSLTATLCGLTPLLTDFNQEYRNHVYQPCLPHVFEALNRLDGVEKKGGEQMRAAGSVDEGYEEDWDDEEEGEEEGEREEQQQQQQPADNSSFTSFPWRPTFMQSTTSTFDKQTPLMKAFGFRPDSIIDKEYLRSNRAKFGPSKVMDNNYFSMPEVTLEEYVRDAFSSARRNKERVFLSHLTSTTHHDWKLPANETYVPLTDDSELSPLSHFVNCVGYGDRWVRRVLDIIREEGAEDETLVILQGDHGLSNAEIGSVSSYGTGHVGNFHVPLVLSHPHLPPIDISDAVSSIQVLPTILDLLAESNSLSPSQTTAARDLAANYEGQSLIRPQLDGPSDTGLGAWQFSLVNPGGTMIAVRERGRPGFRLIVPVVDNVSWRFTDVAADEHEEKPIVAFDLEVLAADVKKRFGKGAAQWVRKAVAVTSWYVDENMERWRYGGKRPRKGSMVTTEDSKAKQKTINSKGSKQVKRPRR